MPDLNPDFSCDVLIVGAGPVGLTTAMELSRRGLKCRIVDRAAMPTDKSKAIVLWARTLELLNNAGLAEEFISAGTFVNGASIYGGGKRVLQVKIDRDDTAYPRPLMLAQSETEWLLNESLTRLGVKVERPVDVTELAEVHGYVEATLVHGDGHAEHVRTPWVVGCDGSHSTVRKRLGLPFTGEFEPNDWLLADVHMDGPVPRDEISAYWHRDGVLIFFPFARNRFRIIVDQGLAKNEAKPADPTLEEVQAVVDHRGPTGTRLHDPVWLAGFRIHERKVDRYGIGRIFLAGDAAHVHSPAGGQGMNTGMQDAFNLTWKLALVHHGHAAMTLLDSYSAERSPVGDLVLRNAAAFTKVATLRNPILQFARNQAIGLLGKLPAVQERAIIELSELAIHYPDSPLNGDDPGEAWDDRVKPGDRLPDADMIEASSQQSLRLYDALRGTGHDLLLLPVNDAAIDWMARSASDLADAYRGLITVRWIVQHAAVAQQLAERGSAWVDAKGQLRERLGVKGSAFVLVRPDKYIVFRGNPQAMPALRSHLHRYLFECRG